MTKLPIIEIDPEEMARLMGEMVKDSGPSGPSDLGVTTREYADSHGVSLSTARRHIRKLRDQGLLIEGTRYARRIDGRWQIYPVYRPKDKTE